ncbi:hypothetical protein B0T26DRAFT_737653 [Lasiosphaeria miniovina]|uniref:Uncharacterized protein n=1 Tax=Lasiosphaeria miniovina TaxID=1954250 RepID=A0AA40BJC9_9PEZI|nr:uncharacterized protein B0T26DRAFT_737653 [Lasiosphaeria miniovina]KAK0735280.1 hypothetical protein B0T26DRAFT_737653 [Lasiosphaeria miniovina]
MALGVLGNPIASEIRQDLSPCATVRCAANTTCEVINGNQAKCVLDKGEICGITVCAADLVCCNPSCGICTRPNMACTQQVCEVPPQKQCGTKLCPTGQVCCNSSCGICTPPGGFCTQQFCG